MSSEISGPELIKLKNAIVQYFDAGNWKELGALTDTLDEVTNHPRLLRSLRFQDPDYDEHVFTFLQMMIGENGENADVVRGYVARTCPEIGENVSSSDNDGRRIVFSPDIFEVPSESVNPNLVAVMMPFDTSMDAIYEAIKGAASDAGLECGRVDDIWEHSTVVQDVFSLIFKSYIVVCDFTGKNPNVFYEAGIAHTLGKHVIPITQSAQDVPFDLQHHRYAQYLNNSEGREKLQEELRSRFRTLSKEDGFW
jgi:hypothetical protein